LPQLPLSSCRLVHAVPQSIWPVAHPQTPALHVSVGKHALPHVPQLLGSLDRKVHVPLQFASPPAHPVAQAEGPASFCPQTGVGAPHVAPHAPQFDVEPRLVGQPVPASAQSENPEAHVYEHFPAVQLSPVVLTCKRSAQLAPHAPQLFTSVPFTSTQLPAQSVVDPGHAQAPDWHVAPPVHAVQEAPQCIASLDGSTHVPPQSACPDGHAHTPA
jgi:hypothetical protein